MSSYEHHLDRHAVRHQVPHYRAIVFDADWQATESFDIDAVSDEEALFLARERAGTSPFELLDGMSVLGRFTYEGAGDSA
ncbi:hypothetical protein ACYQR9_00015 (plasmid) [Methylobacterium sp. CM6241]